MNGVQAVGFSRGFPAISVVRTSPQAPAAARGKRSDAGDAALLAAVRHPPRTGETRPIAALLPDVLAQYQLNRSSPLAGSHELAALDV